MGVNASAGRVTADISGNVTTVQGTYGQLEIPESTGTSYTAAVPAGKRWRIVSVMLVGSTTATLCWIDNGAGTKICDIARAATVATYGATKVTTCAQGDCVAIVDATQRIGYSANAADQGGLITYVIEDA